MVAAHPGAALQEADAGTLGAPIVGGTEAQPGDWPDVVAILDDQGGLCSGTLIGPDLVLTAGHCIGGVPREVIVGSVDLAAADGQWRTVKWAKAYPDWEHTYDVGIVMLENPVQVKQRAIAQNCTSGKRNRLNEGTRLEVVGFGLTTKTATDRNTRLHAATIDVVDGLCERDVSCQEAVAPGGEFTAGGHGVDACFGDSGGPVFIETSTRKALVGIVSRGLATWSDPCGEGGVFVRAEPVIAWIEQESRRRVDTVECDLPRADDPDAGGDGDGDGHGGGGGDGGGDGDSDGDGVPDSQECGAGSFAGCHAAGGLVGSGLALVYGVVCALALRRLRAPRRRARR